MATGVSQINHHPKRVLQEVQTLASDFSRVDFSMNLNDLVQAKKVSMSAIWRSLENGKLLEAHLHIEPGNIIYAKLEDIIAGSLIHLDICIQTINNERRLIVLWAEEMEELL